MKSRYIRIIVQVVVVVVIAFLGVQMMFWLFGFKEEQPKVPPKEIIRQVEVKKISYDFVETEIIGYGRVGTSQPLKVAAEVQGRILPGAVPLRPGQRFARGQVLVRLDNEEARLNLVSAKSNFLQLMAAALVDLKIDYPDHYPAWQEFFNKIDVQKPLPPIPAFEDQQLKVFISTKGILRDYYTILSQQERLSKYVLTAPFNGSITEVMLETGSIANPGAAIAEVIRTDALELEVPLPVDDARDVNQGDVVKIFSENKQFSWQGKVLRVGQKVDPATQSVNIYVAVMPNQEVRIFDGMYLMAMLPVKEERKAMAVPRKTVFDKNKVYVVEDSLLQIKTITVHRVTEDEVLFSGIEPGVPLVLDPPVMASEGLKVIAVEK